MITSSGRSGWEVNKDGGGGLGVREGLTGGQRLGISEGARYRKIWDQVVQAKGSGRMFFTSWLL